MNTQIDLSEMEIRTFLEAHENPKRQQRIKRCREGRWLSIEKKGTRDDGFFTVGVYVVDYDYENGTHSKQIGCITRQNGLNEIIWNLLDNGWTIRCKCLRWIEKENGMRGMELLLWHDEEPLGRFFGAVCGHE